jgi:tetratricopeptide (TPR) repeat protein/tRNA A-37 threonylcarbamoyl transferase component Bud32
MDASGNHGPARAENLFQNVLDLPPDARSAYLERQCRGDDALRAEVDSLLRHYRTAQGAFLEAPPAADAIGVFPDRVPERIGNYRILREIGRGGMGTVYEAEQERPKRRVAIKVVQPGLATPKILQRFEHEAQFLARLKHPGIAQIYEAGASDGPSRQPFLAMEFVEGRRLLQYAEEHRLPTRALLGLMVKICDAVHHAHQKGVMHRDLKPANILVDATGQPKVLDFGVARATDVDLQLTTVQADARPLIGTIAYMSPEQVCGDAASIDTRSDVYALGVIAYQLLTGRLPHDLSDKSLAEAARTISDVDPPPISSINRTLGGDLQVIVSHALAKSPAERYQSAADLGADLGRYLRNEPIAAKPATALYQLRKLISRHKAPAALAATLFLAVSGFAAGMSLLYARSQANLQRAVHAERAATTETETARQVTQFLMDLFNVSNPSETLGNTITVREVLDAAAVRIDTALEERPVVRASLMSTLGTVYQSLGLYPEARSLLERAVDILPGRPDDESSASAAVLMRLGDFLYEDGKAERAEALLREALNRFESAPNANPLEVANCRNTLGCVLLMGARHDEAERLLRAALTVRREHLGPDDPLVGQTLNNLARAFAIRGNIRDAEKTAREAVELLEAALDPKHPDLVTARTTYAQLLIQFGRFDEAEAQFDKVWATGVETLGARHPRIAEAVMTMGHTFWARGDYDKAIRMFREALAIREALSGRDNPLTAAVLNNLGATYLRQGALSRAEETFREVLAIYRGAYGPKHPDVAMALNNLGVVLKYRGEYDEAESLLRESLAQKLEAHGPDHPAVAFTVDTLAELQMQRGHYDEAEAGFREALRIRRNRLGDVHRDVGQSLTQLGELYFRREAWSEAEAWLLEAIDVLEKSLGEAHPSVAYPLETLGRLQMRTGRYAAAESTLRRAVTLREKGLPPESWETAVSRSALGECLAELGRFEDAESLLEEAHDRIASAGVADRYEAEARRRLVRLYELWQRPAEALRWSREASPRSPSSPRSETSAAGQ